MLLMLEPGVQHGGRTGGALQRAASSVVRIGSRGAAAAGLRDAAESAVRMLDYYARLFPIADRRESSDTKQSPTTAPTRTRKDQSADTRKPPLTCINSECPRQDSNLRHRL